MNAEEMQRKIVDYEQRINEYERRMVRYERMIGRLEDDIFNRDDEIRRAKFTLVEALPELNPTDLDPNVNILRAPGRLDREIFHRACVKACLTDPSNHDNEDRRETRGIELANALHSEWTAKLNGDWMLHITGPDQLEDDELDFIRMEKPDILDVKEKYGDELYNTIKIAWYEVQERRRTGVMFKPWNYVAGREQTLTELLGLLQERIQILRNEH